MAERIRQRRTHAWVLALSVLVTVVTTIAFDREIRERDRARFANAVQSTHDRVRSRLDTYVALLVATRSFFNAKSPVELGEFREYIRGLELQEQYGGIQGIGFSMRIPPEKMEAVEGDIRRQGHRSFRVWPESPRPEYHSIVFLEPLDRRNEAAIGYDMFSEPVRHAAMARARDTAAPAASGKVTLVQEIDPEKQAGFLIYVPVYRGQTPADLDGRRAALLGFVYSPFRAGDLFAGLFGSETSPRVAFEVYDGDAPTAETLMASIGRASRREARFETITTMEVAGRTWTLAYRSTPAFEAGSTRTFLPAVALVGLAASLALFFITRAQVRARARAEASEESLKLQARVLESMSEGVSVSDETGTIIYTNRAEDEMFGYAPGELVGKHVTVQNTYPADENDRIVGQVIEQLNETGVWSGEWNNVKKDGTRFFTSARITALDIGGRRHFVCVQADVTEQKRTREEREKLLVDLQQAVRVRDDFLSVAGHELKTPLAALKLQVQGLVRQAEKGAFGSADTRLGERLEKAAGHVLRLERLVSELLDVSRIGGGQMILHREDVELSALLADVVERFGEQLARAGCSSSVRCPAPVRGEWDRGRLDQVFTNLLANAMKYGPGQPIEIVVEQDGDQARVSVRDHGIGIAPEDHERIFGRFERAVSERHYGGLGLGLWISRQIVEAHGGHIAMKSTPGDGSTFIVELPIRPAARDAA